MYREHRRRPPWLHPRRTATTTTYMRYAVMGSRPRNSNRAAKRMPRSVGIAKATADRAGNRGPGEALSKLSTAIALVETVSFAMRTHGDEPDVGSIAASLEVACCQLVRAYSDIDLALMRGVCHFVVRPAQVGCAYSAPHSKFAVAVPPSTTLGPKNFGVPTVGK
jgi:hypothetical protein